MFAWTLWNEVTRHPPHRLLSDACTCTHSPAAHTYIRYDNTAATTTAATTTAATMSKANNPLFAVGRFVDLAGGAHARKPAASQHSSY